MIPEVLELESSIATSIEIASFEYDRSFSLDSFISLADIILNSKISPDTIDLVGFLLTTFVLKSGIGEKYFGLNSLVEDEVLAKSKVETKEILLGSLIK